MNASNVREHIYEFVEGIHKLDEKEYFDYIIFADPRTMALVYCSAEKEISDLSDRIFSFEKIDDIGNCFYHKKVLIAVFMHMYGIDTFHLYSSIMKYNPKSIYTFAEFAEINYPDYYFCCTTSCNIEHGLPPHSDEIAKIIKVVHYEITADYYRYLGIINTFLFKNRQPYVSGLYGFDISKDEYKKFINNSNVTKLKNVETIFGKPKYYQCELNYSFISSAFIRVYKKSQNRFLVVPSVELVPIKCEQINEIWNYLNLPIEVKSDIDKYKFIRAVLSFALFKMYFSFNDNETKWLDIRFIPDFIRIINKNLYFDDIFKEIEDVVGEITKPSETENHESIMEKNLNKYKWKDVITDYRMYIGFSWEDMLGYLHEMWNAQIDQDGYLYNAIPVDQNIIKPISMHKMLTKIDTNKLDEFYAMLLYFYDSDCFRPRIKSEDGFIETYLDIFYC